MSTTTITETGCYLDSHRGHYLARDVVYLAQGFGFIVDPFAQWTLDTYEAHSHEESYPSETVYEYADEAVAWLNNGQDERLSGQNFPPIIPDGYAWEYNEGDFGLYPLDSDD